MPAIFVAGHGQAGVIARAAGLEQPLSRLRAPMGVIAVLGNHDHWTSPEAVGAALKRAGVILLVNRAIRRGPLAVIGVDDAFSGHEDIASAIASWKAVGGVPIILTHLPGLVGRLGTGIPFVAAGHTHCGQIVIPGFGPLLGRSPLQHWKRLYDPRYRCGIVRTGGRTVVVTAALVPGRCRSGYARRRTGG